MYHKIEISLNCTSDDFMVVDWNWPTKFVVDIWKSKVLVTKGSTLLLNSSFTDVDPGTTSKSDVTNVKWLENVVFIVVVSIGKLDKVAERIIGTWLN